MTRYGTIRKNEKGKASSLGQDPLFMGLSPEANGTELDVPLPVTLEFKTDFAEGENTILPRVISCFPVSFCTRPRNILCLCFLTHEGSLLWEKPSSVNEKLRLFSPRKLPFNVCAGHSLPLRTFPIAPGRVCGCWVVIRSWRDLEKGRKMESVMLKCVLEWQIQEHLHRKNAGVILFFSSCVHSS